MTNETTGLARSIHTRLVAHAKELEVDPNLVLTRFAIERFLYRLSRSPYAEQFVLKGALLLLVWLGETLRPTRDADLLGFGDLSEETLAEVFRSICTIDVEPDGVDFDPESIRVTPIRQEDPYGGTRITLTGHLGAARIRVQVDVGTGDTPTPEPTWLEYPSLLDLPKPRLRAYRPETAIAEKVHAMVVLGSKNSRMRDFFDVYALAEHASFEGRTLSDAIRTTFARRRTPIPQGIPLALTSEFADSREKKTQWTAFLRKNRLDTAPKELRRVVEGIAAFIGPVLSTLASSSPFDGKWPAAGPWST